MCHQAVLICVSGIDAYMQQRCKTRLLLWMSQNVSQLGCHQQGKCLLTFHVLLLLSRVVLLLSHVLKLVPHVYSNHD